MILAWTENIQNSKVPTNYLNLQTQIILLMKD